MSLKNDSEDVSDEELDKIINPFYENYNDFVITYVMPKVISFYIASSYYRNAMCEATLKQHYNSAKDIFNISFENYSKVKKEIIKLLRIKHSLEIISEVPLGLKKMSTRFNSDTLQLFSNSLLCSLKKSLYTFTFSNSVHFLLFTGIVSKSYILASSKANKNGECVAIIN